VNGLEKEVQAFKVNQAYKEAKVIDKEYSEELEDKETREFERMMQSDIHTFRRSKGGSLKQIR